MVRFPYKPSTAGCLLACAFAVRSCMADASAAEVCRFAGSTDFAGHVAVTTNVAQADGVTKVAVAVRFEATTMVWRHIRYLTEEVSTWRGEMLQDVAVNSRYLVGEQIVRQQWDSFQRGPNGLQAYRVQAKTLADFRLHHPGFVQHWDPATFGQPWLGDYKSASPERRADLDPKVSPLPAGLRSPLAMAFYWVRWLSHDGQVVPVFLPGFKTDQLLELPVTASSSTGGILWRAPLRYPALSETPPSVATAWTSPDRHLQQLAFELHGSYGSARGLIAQQGCEGIP
jgi:hypothetical protein